MLLLVGLGNPGAKYAGNRHNIGFMAVNAIARAYGFGPWKKKFHGELAEGHIDAGQRVWLVSAAPIELAELIAEHLGLSGALGTVSEQVHGVYTGRLSGKPLHGEAKAEAIAELAARENLDLSRCAAYSDSANDIPMLSMVGTPVAVNPDRALRLHARRNGWTIRDYRTARRVVKITAPAVGIAGLVTGIAVGAVMARRAIRG